jgi:hypothetical protein
MDITRLAERGKRDFGKARRRSVDAVLQGCGVCPAKTLEPRHACRSAKAPPMAFDEPVVARIIVI